MRIMQRINQLSWKERFLMLESVAGLALARIYIKVNSFRRLCQKIGTLESEPEALGETDLRARALGKMIERVSHHLPWNCQCLTQAVAAHYMLKRRGLSSVIYIGVKKEENNPELFSHAWLKNGEQCITGEKDHQNFKIIMMLGTAP